ncbi:hypothetical protein TRFO_17396 [Tritrichomonas foetus]|uniref:RING-type E3 ubiquitin transferase n=1 Tax=Tritrichomonas foetus TaxID=1144522 RepID=A0A1J4KP41_9EUKA|nr:hypothetical protein TRFO_17396 [Tritrichomonas foetus]|eukprot:OHT12688.1 hypothetical protein TRFO_17396 [Tritrichomonas foetus]
MSESQAMVQCPICLSSIGSEGDHQICTLKCGHLFGYICLIQCLENKPECPVCRRKATGKDVVQLVWDKKLPVDSMAFDQLNNEKEQLLLKQQELVTQLKKVNKELSLTKDNLTHALNLSSSFSSQNAKKFHSKLASVVYERKVVDSFRLLVVNNQLLVSEKTGNKYGIQFSSLLSTYSSSQHLSFKQSSFLALHDAQIRDISSSTDFSNIATASLDKSIAIINNRSLQISQRINSSIPLWSCCWTSNSVVAAGGNQGKLFICDIRDNSHLNMSGSTGKEYQIAQGPPIFSVAPIDTNRILCVSPILGRYFDLRNLKLEPNTQKIAGGHLVSFCKESGNYLVLSRNQQNGGAATYYSLKSDGYLHETKTKEIKYFSTMARPSILLADSVLYTTLPDEEINDFSIFASNRGDEDLWGKWRGNFPISAHSSPVLDVHTMRCSSTQLMVFSLSSSLLRVNMLNMS